jgi:hypothetical protein
VSVVMNAGTNNDRCTIILVKLLIRPWGGGPFAGAAFDPQFRCVPSPAVSTQTQTTI